MVKTIGVIGGGQLARMMITPAQQLGLGIKVLAETEGSSAALAATQVGDYTDLDTVRDFAKTVDVITFDHEHVPIRILETLEAEGFNVQPSSRALVFAQNKLEMRRRLTELGLPVPSWKAVSSVTEIATFLEAHGSTAILKTPTGGYDGKGVMVISDPLQAAGWFEKFEVLLIEEKVEFTRELAQLSARSVSGQWLGWPVVQTIQRDGVCSEVLSPAPDAEFAKAADLAKAIAEGLNVTGVLAVEMFETADGRLLVNELAMRPHNSGHFSIEGSITSQFEQHLRAVADLPLGSTTATQAFAVMLNLLGVDDSNTFIEHYPIALATTGAHIHTYGKSARKGRKMGHITALSDVSLDEAKAIASAAKQALHA
ncbi:MAG: 5-(carboxyamino)imidazole ribonucleotide synthase [Acidobacteria bacterium]|nr:5-(carboxyamino)imidazole ribonucleotide synthase [Acidobacteriota bacterium]